MPYPNPWFDADWYDPDWWPEMVGGAAPAAAPGGAPAEESPGRPLLRKHRYLQDQTVMWGRRKPPPVLRRR